MELHKRIATGNRFTYACGALNRTASVSQWKYVTCPACLATKGAK